MTYGNLIYNPNATFPSSGGVNLITEPNATMVTTGTVPYPRCISRDALVQYYDSTADTGGQRVSFYTVPSTHDLYLQVVTSTIITSNRSSYLELSFAPPNESQAIMLAGPYGFAKLDYMSAPIVMPAGTSFKVKVVNVGSSISYLMLTLAGILTPADSGLQ